METQIRKFASRSRFKTNGCHRSLPKSGTFKNKIKKDARMANEGITAATNCNGNYDKRNFRKNETSRLVYFPVGQRRVRSSQNIHFFILVFESSSSPSLQHCTLNPILHKETNHTSQLLQKVT